MTNEEAIKNIKEHCYFANLIPQAKEALDMAIKALEQEPILDKIRAEMLQLKTKTSFTFVNIDDVLRLIDKHKESKENDGI